MIRVHRIHKKGKGRVNNEAIGGAQRTKPEIMKDNNDEK